MPQANANCLALKDQATHTKDRKRPFLLDTPNSAMAEIDSDITSPMYGGGPTTGRIKGGGQRASGRVSHEGQITPKTALSVIIPAYVSAPDVLTDVLRNVQSVRSTTDPAQVEIIVQDDASPAVNLVPLLGPICARNPQNLGFPGNCNAGAARASGELLLFLNQDAWITQRDWVARLLDFFAVMPQAGIVGPTLLFPDGRVQSVGGGFDAAHQPYHHALGARNPGWEPISRPRPVAWITGAALVIRADLWRALGGFDAAYGRGYFEDVDLCLRAGQIGAETWHYPGLQFWHRVGSTGGSSRFEQNARRFKARWVDSGLIEPDTAALKEHFWA